MRTVKILWVLFVAALAFGLVGAGSASALLFLTGLAKELFTLANLNSFEAPAVLETAGKNKIECESILGHGSILEKTDQIEKMLFTFHGCVGRPLLGNCSSAGEPTGLITTLELDALLVTLLPGSPTNGKFGILVLAEKGNQDNNLAFVSCSTGVNFAVRGTVTGQFTETPQESELEKTESRIKFSSSGVPGEQSPKVVWTLQGLRTDRLESILTGIIGETAETSLTATADMKTPNGLRLCHK